MAEMIPKRTGAKTSFVAYDDMDGILANIMLMCALMLTISISLFGTVPMADMMLWDYQSALIWDETYRSFVVQHLAQKSFNFTKEIGPNTVFDIRKVLENRGGPSAHTRTSTSDKWVKNMNWAFHMTKDSVDPWVMSTVAESSFSKILSWCYVSSVNIFTTCLLVSFFHYIALKMSSLGEKGGLKLEPQENPTEKQSTLLKKQLYWVGWYVYILGWVLLFAMLVGIYTTFWGVMELGRARFPQLALFQEQVFRHTLSAAICSVVGFILAGGLQLYIHGMDFENDATTRAGPAQENWASARSQTTLVTSLS